MKTGHSRRDSAKSTFDQADSKSANVSKAKESAIKRAVAAVDWQDLRQLTRFQTAYNILLPYPFLLLSWWFASQSWYVMACAASYLFFASAFRQAHDGYHHSLGIGKRGITALLILLSVLLFTGLHSIRATHMEHHRNPLGDSDIEGRLAKMSWWQALLGGVAYRIDIYREGLRLSNRRNRRMAWLEFALIALAVMVMLVLNVLCMLSILTEPAYITVVQVFNYHLLTMLLANASVGIIAVWGVHHDCDDTVARTERHTLVNLLTFNLLYHVEHHLFPAVPSNHLPELAKRLDDAAPQLTEQHVLPTMNTIMNVVDNLLTDLKNKYHHYSGNNDNDCPIRKRFA